MGASVQKNETTTQTVSVGTALVSSVIMELVGNDISDSINKQPMNENMVGQIAAARFQAALKTN